MMSKRKGNLDKQISLRLTPELHEQWSAEAEARGIKIPTLIRLRMAGRDVFTTARKAG